jgi:SpoIID/LytB domain protein
MGTLSPFAVLDEARSVLNVAQGEVLTLTARGGSVEIRTPRGTSLSLAKVIVRPSGSNARLPTPLMPAQGLEITPIVAGRTFHWRKEVSLVFPGSFEITAQGDTLQVVNEVDFEDYCACVITSEMSAECPHAFAFAQATAARTWTHLFLRDKHPGASFQVCNDDDCQRYQGTTFLTAEALAAVSKSRGVYVQNSEGNTYATYYAKGCGGYIEDPRASFGFSVPGLRARSDSVQPFTIDLTHDETLRSWLENPPRDVCCSPQWIPEDSLSRYLGAVDNHGSYFRWQHEISRAEIAENLRERLSVPELREIVTISIGPRGESGRILHLDVVYHDSSGRESSLRVQGQYMVRRVLHSSFLYSSAFVSTWRPGKISDEDILSIRGAGWGHGVGLCQIGALGMALRGFSGDEILAHYFPESKLVSVSQ